jgi:hypothetical protein
VTLVCTLVRQGIERPVCNGDNRQSGKTPDFRDANITEKCIKPARVYQLAHYRIGARHPQTPTTPHSPNGSPQLDFEARSCSDDYRKKTIQQNATNYKIPVMPATRASHAGPHEPLQGPIKSRQRAIPTHLQHRAE